VSIQFDDKKFFDYAQKKKIAGLQLVGAFVDGEIAKNIKKQGLIDTGNMVNSRTFKVYEGKSFVRCSVNTVYAAIQELGGMIKPDKAGALTVPIHPDAKKLVRNGGSARDMKDLEMIKRKNGPPLLVRKKEKGKNQRFDIMFVLLKSVQIPARPYMRPAVYENKDMILKIFAKAKAA